MHHGILVQPYLEPVRSMCQDTARILEQSKLYVHPAVKQITLHGSRSPAGSARPDSDLDLSLVTDTSGLRGNDLARRLHEVLVTSLEQSECPVELDLAAVFDARQCGLVCFTAPDYEHLHCPQEATGCPGVYKIQKGFEGLVPPITEISKIFPFVTIWRS